MSNLTLTQDQQIAHKELLNFVLHPTEKVHILKGYAGTGKTTLLKELAKSIPAAYKMRKLIASDLREKDIKFTATTNKAVEVLGSVIGRATQTTFAHMGVKPSIDYGANGKLSESGYVLSKNSDIQENQVIVIDETSNMTSNYWDLVHPRMHNCKVILCGDPCQTIHHSLLEAPMFNKGFNESTITEIVRNNGQISELGMLFRDTVLTGKWHDFTPNNQDVAYLSRDDFNKEMLWEFSRKNQLGNDAKVLQWSNKSAINHNKYISRVVKGSDNFKIGDYAIVNKFISNKNCYVRTDQEVLITGIERSAQHNLKGNMYTLNDTECAFMPDSNDDKLALLADYQSNRRVGQAKEIMTQWVDLRSAYACTVNKSMGSTYKRAFIDLDDINKCRNDNQVARMLYVATTRASEQVILTGDITGR